MNNMVRVSTSHISRSLITINSTNDPVITKLLSFQQLPDGWHYGRGVAPSLNTVMAALSAIDLLRQQGADTIEVFPDVDGEILVSAYSGDICIDANILAFSPIKYVVERGDVEIAADAAPNLHVLMKKIGEENWLPSTSSALSTQNTTAMRSGGSNHLLSKTQTVPVSLWSMNRA